MPGTSAIVVCYAGSKYIMAMMYFVSKRRHKESVELAKTVGWVILAGATISLVSISSRYQKVPSSRHDHPRTRART